MVYIKKDLEDLEKSYYSISLLDRSSLKEINRRATVLYEKLERSSYTDLEQSDIDKLEKIMSFTSLKNLE